MKVRFLVGAALAVTLAACEQQSQTLPFSADSDGATVRTASATEPSAITSPAGAALQFPAGAFDQAVEITVTPVAPPAAIAESGSPVSRGFQIAPAGLALNVPARVEIRLDDAVDPSRAWLASAVLFTADGVEEIGSTRLDLRARLAETSIRRLGTVALVIPDPRAVFVTRSAEVQPALAPVATTLLPTGTDSAVASCGDSDERCEGLTVTASANLVDKVDQAAAVYPRVAGALRFAGLGASGEITLSSSVRLLLKSGATSEYVEVRGLLRPTDATVMTEDASSITLTNVYVRVSGSAGSGSGVVEETRTVVIEKGVDAGFVTFSRSFQLDDDQGVPGDASVAITFPVRIHQ